MLCIFNGYGTILVHSEAQILFQQIVIRYRLRLSQVISVAPGQVFNWLIVFSLISLCIRHLIVKSEMSACERILCNRIYLFHMQFGRPVPDGNGCHFRFRCFRSLMRWCEFIILIRHWYRNSSILRNCNRDRFRQYYIPFGSLNLRQCVDARIQVSDGNQAVFAS